MKRTRRIEVIRYRSWVTTTTGETLRPYNADEQQAGDSIVDLLGVIAPAPAPDGANCDGLRPNGDIASDRPRSFLRLRALLRLRK